MDLDGSSPSLFLPKLTINVLKIDEGLDILYFIFVFFYVIIRDFTSSPQVWKKIQQVTTCSINFRVLRPPAAARTLEASLERILVMFVTASYEYLTDAFYGLLVRGRRWLKT